MALRWNSQARCFQYEFWLAGRYFKQLTGFVERAPALQVEREVREALLRRELDARLLGDDDAVGAAEAWAAVTDVIASTYGLPVEVLRSQSRGRGPRPPRATWEARKLAIYLTVLISGAEQALVGGFAGLHKDTASSHCIWARETCAENDEIERLTLALEYMARLRLKLSAMKRTKLRSAA